MSSQGIYQGFGTIAFVCLIDLLLYFQANRKENRQYFPGSEGGVVATLHITHYVRVKSVPRECLFIYLFIFIFFFQFYVPFKIRGR